ncbi:LLM class flavin-dependent oxidoreductase [Actinoplanes derwentensis]|uniref:Luciferase family oxidoreductase, group 1 n=1 Tax=Actinoplanes derwentensis TaxID=113562 RepID=A0A1H2D8I2_9ACTN|nr:LLM class flavin-dependent oxidoreductase [Actinoplanes derwentensis]GID89704.1 alkane monooxygenase [Actinoplanes derwentensis]SDT78894.1 luciferase family oxidoreductase, group 1 [Actinoplanes derwentensis]
MQLSILDQSMVPEGSTPTQALTNTIDLARAADALGYHRYWLAEHHATASFASPAPEIMTARLSAETTGLRIGSGGVLLPYYSPFKVAETFRVLQALAPGRVDLGIGRGSGATARDARLLNPALGHPSDHAFAEQVSATRAFLGERGDRDGIMPPVDGMPEIWLLGASPSSAALAGRLGLPYSFAHFGRPEIVTEAVRAYRQSFDGSGGGTPRVMAGIGVYCAPTRAEAERVFASQRLFRQRMSRGDLRPVPAPETALAELHGRPEIPPTARPEWPSYAVGSPAEVAEQLTAMAAAVGIDEFVVLSTIHGHEDRVRSYALLAEALGVRPRRVAATQGA